MWELGLLERQMFSSQFLILIRTVGLSTLLMSLQLLSVFIQTPF